MPLGRSKPFKFYPFSKKQKQLLYWWDERSPYSDRDVVIAHGAIRSGKTISMLASFLLWGQRNFSDEAFIVAGKSVGSLKRNVIRPMTQILETWGWQYRWNRAENYLVIGDNTYYLFGANNEASQDLVQGLTSAGFYGDEVTLFPKSFTDQAMSRCSVKNSRIFLNCNPSSPHHYIKTEYIDDCIEKHVFPLHFRMEDNLSLAKSIIERYERLYSGVFYKRYVLGEWVMAEGIIYDMFDPSVNTYTKLPQGKFKRVIGVDYGSTNPTSFVDIRVEDRQDRVRFYIENVYYFDAREEGWTKTDSQYADDFEEFVGSTRPNKIFVDPSATSFITELRFRGFNALQGNNDVLDGIRSIATLMYNRDMKVNTKCTPLLDEISEYSWDDKAQEKGIDQPLKVDDHACDAMRYGVFSYLKGRSVILSNQDDIPNIIGN